jgi:hypothetical protein
VYSYDNVAEFAGGAMYIASRLSNQVNCAA